jgi:lipopolysaccharide export system ATP-binding protein
MPEVLRVDHLVKTYGERNVVDGVSLHVGAAEIVGLLGPNGAGKTTSFHMITGMIRPASGSIHLGGEDVTAMPMYRRARRGLGYLPQEESIFRKLSVEDNLMAILETLPLTPEERHQRCDDLIFELGIGHIRKSKAFQLSGGEKRRLAIARCLATEPSILLLDEPFSGVDPKAVSDIQDIILALSRRGLAVLITDHNVRETLHVVARAYLICEGRVESEGSSEFLVNDPIARELYLGPRFNL